jgi:hypothetical protein
MKPGRRGLHIGHDCWRCRRGETRRERHAAVFRNHGWYAFFTLLHSELQHAPQLQESAPAPAQINRGQYAFPSVPNYRRLH